MSVADIPKVELHVHLEGTAPPDLVRRLADRNGLRLPDGLLAAPDRFAWRDFMVSDYDDSSQAKWLEDTGIDLYRGDGRIDGPGCGAGGTGAKGSGKSSTGTPPRPKARTAARPAKRAKP